MSAAPYPLTVYYDASCPLCAAELHALRDCDDRGRLRLVDCSGPGFRDPAVTAAGLDVAALMRLIHARDAGGAWYRGVDVFVLIYRAVGIETIARLWAHPWLRPLWDRLYPQVARHRQLLSRLGLHPGFGWYLRRAARRAARQAARRAQQRSRACAAGQCAAGGDRSSERG